ncbi:MAG: alpha-L-arabinofuranosidase C-terminal domain-containing protein [Bacteroidota bacterium]
MKFFTSIFIQKLIQQKIIAAGIVLFFLSGCLPAQSQSILTLQIDKQGSAVSKKLYGLMTEEINYSYDGGLYAELIRNRIFKDNSKSPDAWTIVKDEDSKDTLKLDNAQPINDALTVCVLLNIQHPGKREGIANAGYWGIPVKPSTVYHGSFYAKTDNAGKSLTISIESKDGKITYASAVVSGVGSEWKRYEFTVTTAADIKPTADTRFVIAAADAGKYWFNLVSLFPPTYKNRINGNRADIMQLLADMKPAFLRLPGGNYLEGQMFSSRFAWKKTLGNLDQRPGHMGTWSYRSSDGMGLLEYLEWCEDLKMEPLLAVFAGYTLNRDYLDSGALLKPFADEALEEIEYVMGDANTRWGAKRALDGHPEPFHLTYVEIGNEDGFDMSNSYERRYLQFYDAIKAKYPQLQIISTVGGKDPLGQRVKAPVRNLDIMDEHYYRNAWEMEEDAAHYDNYDRKGPKVFVGEWATREGEPTPNFNSALGDAAWMTGMERNSDLVIMSCSAPLFVNVNPGAMQWKSDLIGYNTLTSYGSPSYYAQKMFSNNVGDEIIPITGENIATRLRGLTKRDSLAGMSATKQIPVLFYVATRNKQTGTVYLKVVNAGGTNQSVNINIAGVAKVIGDGIMTELKADKPEDTNSIKEPEKIKPVVSKIKGIGKKFNRVFPANSITVLQLETK